MQRAPFAVEEPPDTRNDKVIDYQGENEIASSELQVAFEGALAQGRYGRPTAYKKVAVLTLRWEDEHDNLKVQNEVEKLEKVFEDYHFSVTSKTIPCPQRKNVQTAVNRIIAEWVDINDEEEHLLIVYYAGHGRPGDANELVLFNNSRTKPSQANDFVWNKAENNVQDAAAHVFLIFDCCHAGDLRGPNKTFEYLAATGRGKTTPAPGPASFTSALIWALKEFSKEHQPFNTSQLTKKIREAPDFHSDQAPVLTNRDSTDDSAVGRIMLYQMPTAQDCVANRKGPDRPGSPSAPVLTRDRKKITIEPKKAVEPPFPGYSDDYAQNGKIFTMHFDLEKTPRRKNIEAFARLLSQAPEVKELGVLRIRWGNLRPGLIHRAAEAFARSPKPRNGRSLWAGIRGGLMLLNKTAKQSSETHSPPLRSSQETAVEEENPRISRAATLPLVSKGQRNKDTRKYTGARTLESSLKTGLSS